MATGDYTSLANLKDFCEIPASDTTRDIWLNTMIPVISRAIDRHCHRVFYPVTKSRVYDYQTSHKLFLKDDLQSCTQILHGASRAEVLPTSSYFLYPEIGPPYQWIEISESSTYVLRWSTPTPQQSIQVDGVWGYLENGSTPNGIGWACHAWINYLYKLGKNAGIQSTTIGDYTVSYNNVLAALNAGPPNEVAFVLDSFVRRSNFATNDRKRG